MGAKPFVKFNEFELMKDKLMKNKLMKNKNMMSFMASLSLSFTL
jgi:hypothetical protein